MVRVKNILRILKVLLRCGFTSLLYTWDKNFDLILSDGVLEKEDKALGPTLSCNTL